MHFRNSFGGFHLAFSGSSFRASAKDLTVRSISRLNSFFNSFGALFLVAEDSLHLSFVPGLWTHIMNRLGALGGSAEAVDKNSKDDATTKANAKRVLNLRFILQSQYLGLD